MEVRDTLKMSIFHKKKRSSKKTKRSSSCVADPRIRFGTTLPIGSMYGIFTYIKLIFMVNVGKYTIHGSYGWYKNWNRLLLFQFEKSGYHPSIIQLSWRISAMPRQPPNVCKIQCLHLPAVFITISWEPKLKTTHVSWQQQAMDQSLEFLKTMLTINHWRVEYRLVVNVKATGQDIGILINPINPNFM